MPEVGASLGRLGDAVERRLGWLSDERVVERIWHRDPTVWGGVETTSELADRLGWLHLPERMDREVAGLEQFAAACAGGGDVRRVVLCGMGGSSLAPEVLWRTHGPRTGYPAFSMLDSTHPAAVEAVDRAGDAAATLYVIASKSGSTIETSSFLEHYWERSGGDGRRFVAITDPGTPLASLAADRGFRRTFLASPDVGGRYSALSLFGLVPAALMGADIGSLIRRAAGMAQACRADPRGGGNPGAFLGAVMAEAALAGRDKLTFRGSGPPGVLGLWVEQLVAESTGKGGKGIVPVVGEAVDPSESPAGDRLLVALHRVREAGDPGPADTPALRFVLPEVGDLGAEFFRWEFATAVACAILGVNGFDQPNVAESKANTAAVLRRGASIAPPEPPERVAALLNGVRTGDYVAILAYLPPSPEGERRLAALAARWRAARGVAVTTGFGPRYLHSTGQLHKGGPATGHFVLVVAEPAQDLAVPGAPYTFGRLIVAQAEGDRAALAARGRPVVRVASLEDLERTEVT